LFTGRILQAAGCTVEAVLGRNNSRGTRFFETLLEIVAGALTPRLPRRITKALVDLATLLTELDTAEIGVVPAFTLGDTLRLLHSATGHYEVRTQVLTRLICLGVAPRIDIGVRSAHIHDQFIATASECAPKNLHIGRLGFTFAGAIHLVVSGHRTRRTLLGNTLSLSPTKGFTGLADIVSVRGPSRSVITPLALDTGLQVVTALCPLQARPSAVSQLAAKPSAFTFGDATGHDEIADLLALVVNVVWNIEILLAKLP